MTAFIDAIGGWVIDHNTLRYLFVVGSIILQGEIGTFISVTLILKNYLSWGVFFAAALGGIVLYDGFLFSIGKALKNKPLGGFAANRGKLGKFFNQVLNGGGELHNLIKKI